MLAVFGLGLLWASVDPFTVLFFLSYAIVGLLLVLRRPGNAVSWLVFAIGFSFLTTTTWPNLDVSGLEAGTAPAWQYVLVWLASWAGSLTFVAYLALTLVFPSGRLPAAPWRLPAIALLGAAVVLAVLPALGTSMYVTVNASVEIVVPNPIGFVPAGDVLRAAPIAVLAPLVIGVASLLVRYRRSRGLDRLQLRWLVATIAFVAASLIGAFVTLAVVGERVGDLVWVPAIIAYPTVPVAIGVAILRYRLYAIDRIISRTVGWAAVTAILGAGFAVVLLAVQALLAEVTQGRSLAVAISTLVAFALLQPVRRRVQSTVDRRFDRARIDAQRTGQRFAERLREEVDMVAIGAELQRTVHHDLRPRTVGVWLRARGSTPVKTP